MDDDPNMFRKIVVINAGIGEHDDYREETSHVLIGYSFKSVQELYEDFVKDHPKLEIEKNWRSPKKNESTDHFFKRIGSQTPSQSKHLADFSAWLIFHHGFEQVQFETIIVDSYGGASYGRDQ